MNPNKSYAPRHPGYVAVTPKMLPTSLPAPKAPPAPKAFKAAPMPRPTAMPKAASGAGMTPIPQISQQTVALKFAKAAKNY